MEDISEKTYEFELRQFLSVPDSVPEDVVLNQYIDWVESNNYTCGGGSGRYVEPKQIIDIIYNIDHCIALLTHVFSPENIITEEQIVVSKYDTEKVDVSCCLIFGVVVYNSGVIKIWDNDKKKSIDYNPFKLVTFFNNLGYDI